MCWAERHLPLDSHEVEGGAVAIPGGDAAQQDALNCASVKKKNCASVCEGLRGQAKFLQPPGVEKALLHLLHPTACFGGPFHIISDVYAEEIEAFSTAARQCG